MIRLVFAALAGSVMIAGCSASSADANLRRASSRGRYSGVCIGGPKVSAECFLNDQVTERLGVNDCVSVTYASESRELGPYRAKEVLAAPRDSHPLVCAGALPADTAAASWTLPPGKKSVRPRISLRCS